MGDPLPRCEFEGQDLIVRREVRLAGHVSAITPAVDEVMTVVREMGCAAGQEYEVEMALREALANAVRHGTRNDATRHVLCCVACDVRRGILLVVRDDGPGFDPRTLPSPIVGQNVFESHGRGIFMINQLMDDVRFEKGGTEIHMRKRSEPPGGDGR
jgi:serine/threonine-protein kinase RsbW